MKTLRFTPLVILLVFSIALGGGIVTNTNHSAAYLRTLNRNATTEVDAAYFNPAGITKLCNGLHLSFSNQSIFQTKEINNNYQYLSESTFTGDVKALLFPNFYAVYKMEKLAFAAGFQPIGGGGSANFEKGLPSFELPVSDLVPGLATQGINVSEYDLDVTFEGSSIYFGGQAGVAYKINDMLSVSVGGRYVSALNNYKGHLKAISINPDGTWMTASTFFTGAAQQYTGAANSATGAADGLTTAVNAGIGAVSLTDADPYGVNSAEVIAGLQQFGIDPTGFTIENARDAFLGAALSASNSADAMTAKAVETGDKEVDAAQKGSGFTPVFGLNISPMEGLNIGLRYEHITKLELENDTKKDDTGLYPNKAKTNADMPAMFAVGVSYMVLPQLRAEVDLNYYMNTGVDWDGKEDNLENDYEVGIALEYAVSEKLRASFGYLHSKSGALEDYQSDLSYSLNSNTIGLGVAYSVMPNLEVNLGGLNCFYQEGEKNFGHLLDETNVPVLEKYNKTAIGFAIGINYKF